MSDPITSHGRGGAANIAKDPTPYADAAIVRQGPPGDQGNGAYSAGRGGAANIGSPRQRPDSALPPGDRDVVPEQALRRAPEVFHVGRGGEGNIHHDCGRHDEGLGEKTREKLAHPNMRGE